ncbi:MAG: response regulator, partial [Desulfobacula sp.]
THPDSVGTLASGIAHDFNTLLSEIMAYLELLIIDQDTLSDTQKDHIAGALISSKKASMLIRQLQALTRSTTLEPSGVDICKIATDVFNILRQTTNPLIEKRIEFSENQFFIKGYGDEIHQVLMNLGMNAVQSIEEKGTPQGSVIRVFIPEKNQGLRLPDKDSFPDSEYLHICFQDNGCGMTQEIRQKAFDPMFSTRKSSDRKSQGLGLATAYYIITKKHHGSIDIETLPGKGTTFHIHLPVFKKPTSEINNDKIPQKKLKTILVIDDEDIVRDMAIKALKAFGYNTLDACDGEAGIQIFKKHHPSIDAVLLDIIMPKMSGTETFKQMLNIDPNVKVIVASGHVTNQDQKKIFAKACAYLDKPYQIIELKQALELIFQ